MSQPFVGQIIMFGGNFPPSGWMTCDGQTLPISEYDTLFNLIGTTYGGDGQSTFLLPNLNGRVPVHMGQGSSLSNYVIGQSAGVPTVALTANQLPSHNHTILTVAGTGGNSVVPANNTVLADEGSNAPGSGNAFTYAPFSAATPAQVAMANASISNTGGGLAHDNLQPYLAVTYVISLFGIYPSPN